MAASTSKRTITVTFSSPGTQPPVYLSGEFTDPPWEPQELTCKTVGQDFEFFKDFEVEVGRWQYKFRLGIGDWWVCDENAEIVTDEAGNRNNLLVVGRPLGSRLISKEDVEETRQRLMIPQRGSVASRNKPTSPCSPTCDHTGVPLLPHECLTLEDVDQSPRDRTETSPQKSPTIGFRDNSGGFARSPTAEDLNDPMLEVFPSDREGILRRLDTLRSGLPPDGLEFFHGVKHTPSTNDVPYLPHEMGPNSTPSRSSDHSPETREPISSGSKAAHFESPTDTAKTLVRKDSIHQNFADVTPDEGGSQPPPSREGESPSINGDGHPLLTSSTVEHAEHEPLPSTTLASEGPRLRDTAVTNQPVPPTDYANDPPEESTGMHLWRKFLYWYSRFWAALIRGLRGNKRDS